MRQWMVLAQHDDSGDRETRVTDAARLERLVVFRSGDGERPMQGDLDEALEGHRFEERTELLLVPLDAGYTLDVRTVTKIDVLSTGNVPV